MLSAKKTCVVQYAASRIEVGKGTIVLISCSGDVLTVRVLHDTHTKSVNVAIEGKAALNLSAGEEMLFAKEGVAFADALTNDGVARRRTEVRDVKLGKLASSEFSIVSLNQSSNVLHNLLISKGAHERRLSQQILRTEACISVVTQAHGMFAVAPLRGLVK